MKHLFIIAILFLSFYFLCEIAKVLTLKKVVCGEVISIDSINNEIYISLKNFHKPIPYKMDKNEMRRIDLGDLECIRVRREFFD